VSRIAGENALNFALYSKHAHRVVLLLYGVDEITIPMLRVAMDPLRNRSGRIWHCRIPCAEIEGARYYAYTVHGPDEQSMPDWHTFEADKILLDPYAPEVHIPPSFDRQAACEPGGNAGRALLGILPRRDDGLVKPKTSAEPRPTAPRRGDLGEEPERDEEGRSLEAALPPRYPGSVAVAVAVAVAGVGIGRRLQNTRRIRSTAARSWQIRQ
jgi:glycogen operon protein